MNKMYYVIIKGRTLESRDLKALLARAVAEKRNLDRRLRQARSTERAIVEDSSHSFGDMAQAATI